MTAAESLDLFTVPGHDRDCAYAMLSQAKLGHNQINDIQVKHLLRIGYTAGRQVTDGDTAFDRLDTKLGRFSILAGGVALGSAMTGVLVWLVG